MDKKYTSSVGDLPGDVCFKLHGDVRIDIVYSKFLII